MFYPYKKNRIYLCLYLKILLTAVKLIIGPRKIYNYYKHLGSQKLKGKIFFQKIA